MFHALSPWVASGCSDVVAVVEIGRVQPVIMPLPPLLHGLPAPLFLLWRGKMKSHEDEGDSDLKTATWPSSPQPTWPTLR